MLVTEEDIQRRDKATYEAHDIYLRLRTLATEDAREARLTFTRILETEEQQVQYILLQSAAPGEGRLRHVIANAVRTHSQKVRIAEHLRQWLEIETDTFARRAIEEAIRDIPPTLSQDQGQGQDNYSSENLLRAYRYVAGQLRHEVRNALIEMQIPLRELRSIAKHLPESNPLHVNLNDQIHAAQTGLKNVGRLVEFETGDEYFTMRLVCLHDWLRNCATRYAETTSVPAELRIHASLGIESVSIRASDHLLNAVFKNIWNNARQAVTTPCIITVHMEVSNNKMTLRISDSGPGFDRLAAEKAFRDPFSTKGMGRGRGLLEISEAVNRLNGTIDLVSTAVGEFRVRMIFPLEVS